MIKSLILMTALIAGTSMAGITVEENVVTSELPIAYEETTTEYIYETDDLTYDILVNRDGKIIVEHIVGEVLDEDGNGLVLNTDTEYNYISYRNVDDFEVGAVYDTYLYYNPDTSYEDDVEYRVDIKRDGK